MPKIVVKKTAEILVEYRVGKKGIITIGSAKGNDIILADKNVSEHHCSIAVNKGVYEIKDNNTIAGTRVNDKPVTVKELQIEDVITLGSYALIFRRDYRNDGKSENSSKDEQGKLQGPPHFFLVGIYGRFEGRKYEIRLGDTFAGRENVTPKGITNDIVLNGDMTVSKGHAKLFRNEEQCVLTDTGSTGGVAVNGNKVGQLNEVVVQVGDEIGIGRTIFRLSEEGKDDYSPPKQHNIFLLKMRKPLITALSVIMLIISLALVQRGMNGFSIIKTKPDKIELEMNRSWSAQDNAVKTALPADYDNTSSVAIGDINNDGVNDVVYFNSAGLLCAWDGRKGTPLWKPVEIYNSGKSSPVLYDMNNDGILDIVVVSDASMLFVIDGATGGIIRREILGGNVAELSPVVCDLNGDGLPDVVVCSQEGTVHFVYAPGFDRKMEKFSVDVDGPVYASPVVIKTKNISPLVVVCSYNSKLYVIDGITREKKTVDLVEKTGKVHLMSAPPAIGDLNGDGVPEIVVLSNVPQYVSVIDIAHFDVNWTYFVEPIPPSGIKHTAPPLITDINGDGLGDVVIFSANGKVYGLKGKTGYPAGELLLKMDVPGGGRLISPPALVNSNQDGMSDIVFGTETGNIFVARSFPQRKSMEIISTIKASNVPITSSVAIGDVTGDGMVKIVYSNVTDAVQMLNTNIRTFKRKIVWPMYLGSAVRAGSLDIQEYTTPYLVMIVSGLGLLLLIVIVAFIARQRSISKRPRVINI
jgi:pSer/pThr/pTyr-binding forkhead associated (FHA) protein